MGPTKPMAGKPGASVDPLACRWANKWKTSFRSRHNPGPTVFPCDGLADVIVSSDKIFQSVFYERVWHDIVGANFAAWGIVAPAANDQAIVLGYEGIFIAMNFIGPSDQVGSVREFDGNSEAGSGKLEFLKMITNQMVQVKLTMTKPIFAENFIEYSLAPEESGTRFTWAMSGDGGFVGKLISVFIDCESLVGGEFDCGIRNLKELIEAQK